MGKKEGQAKGSKCAFHLSEWLGSLDLASDALGITCLFSSGQLNSSRLLFRTLRSGSRGL